MARTIGLIVKPIEKPIETPVVKPVVKKDKPVKTSKKEVKND
jgi:hypothetical protein